MKNKHLQKGFTLVEIIVALMIFSIVVVVALAALVKVIDANKKAQTTQDAVIGLSFALEAMSRELRTGSKLHCESSSNGSFNPTGLESQACAVGKNQLIAFQSTVTDNASVPPCRLYYAYLFTGTGPYVIKKASQPRASNCDDAFNADSFSDITSSNVVLTDYQLGVSYNIATQPLPIAFLKLSGYAGLSDKIRTYFTVQTAASSRVP